MKYKNLSDKQIEQLRDLTQSPIEAIAWGPLTKKQYLKTGLICKVCIAILALDVNNGMLYIKVDTRTEAKVYYAIDRQGKSHAEELGLEFLKNVMKSD